MYEDWSILIFLYRYFANSGIGQIQPMQWNDRENIKPLFSL